MKTSVRSSHIVTTLRRLPLALVLVLALPVQADGGLGHSGARWQAWAHWWARFVIAGPFGAPPVPPHVGAVILADGSPPTPPTGSSCATSASGCNAGVHTTDPDGGNPGGGTSTPTGGGTGGSSGNGTGG